jgi:hypothetical protein
MERTPMWHKQRVGFSGSSSFLSSTSCDQVLASLKGNWMTSSPGMETASNSAFSRTSMIWYRDLAPLFSISSNFCTFIRFTAADIARLVTGTVPRNTCRLQVNAPSINVRCGDFEEACLDFGPSCASAERVTDHHINNSCSSAANVTSLRFTTHVSFLSCRTRWLYTTKQIGVYSQRVLQGRKETCGTGSTNYAYAYSM